VAVRADDLDDDFRFASGLVDLGFPDFAEQIVNEILEKHPNMKARATLIKVQSLVVARKYEDAAKLIDALPAGEDREAIRLELGTAYYRIGELEKAKKIFSDFFGRFKTAPQDPVQARSYADAAYMVSQMLQKAGDRAGAVEYLDKVLSTNPEKPIACALKVEAANLLIDMARKGEGDKAKNLERADKLARDATWIGPSVTLGQAVVSMANVRLLRGDKAGALKLIDQEYKSMLREIDKILEADRHLEESPVARVRFMKAQMLEDDARAFKGSKEETVKKLIAALQEYANVFVKYGKSDVGPDAALKTNDLKAELQSKYGKKVGIAIPRELLELAVETQLNLAAELYRGKKWEDAIREYLRVMNSYPEAPASVRAFGPLLGAYGEMNDTLMVEAVSDYMAERFTGNNLAGDVLMSVGRQYVEQSNDVMYTYVWENYLNGFPKHPRAGTVAYNLAVLKRKAGRDDMARSYFELVVKNFTNDAYYPRSLAALASIDYRASNFVAAIEGYRRVVQESVPSPDKADAQFRLADSLYRSKRYAEAAAEFEALVGWLSPPANPYTPPGDKAAADRNRQLLENGMLMAADSLVRVTEPADAVAAARETALARFDRLIKAYPNHKTLVPKAINGRGRVLLAQGKTEEASKAFEELANKHPDSEEGKDSLATLVRSALEVKKFEVAKGAMDKMLAESQRYRPNQFVTIGQLFLDSGYPEEASRVFAQALKPGLTDDRKILEPALFGAAQGYAGAKKHDEAVKTLQDLLKRYPNSGYFFEAEMMLADAFTQLNKLDEAVASLNTIFLQGATASVDKQTRIVMNAKAQMALATVQIKQKKPREAMASYLRVFEVNDVRNEGVRPLMVEANLEAIRLAQQLGMWTQVLEFCDSFEKTFPRHEKLEEVRKARTEATFKAAGAGGVPVAVPAAPAGQG
jgi:tetratricopeptide (TPR) repeat protein